MMQSLIGSLFSAYLNLWLDTSPLLNLLLRSSMLLAVGLLVALGWRAARPEARTLVYRVSLLGTLGLALLIVVPSAISEGSRWNIPLYSSASGSTTSTTSQGNSDAQTNDSRRMHAAATQSPTTASRAKDSTIPKAQDVAAAPLTFDQETKRDQATNAFITLLLMLWPLVSVVLMGRLLWCHGKVVWMQRRATPIEDHDSLELLRVASLSIGVKPPRLLSSPLAQGPFLCGIFRPTIVLPANYTLQFDAAALRAIFLHEAAHARHRDCLWTYLRQIACALLWPQPLLWRLSKQMEVAAEDACDLAVLEGGYAPRDYARFLLDLAEQLCLTPSQRALGAGVIPRRSSLAHRVEAVLKGVPTGTRRLTTKTRWFTAAGALCVGALCLSFAVDANVPIAANGTVSGRVVYADGRPANGLEVTVEIQEAEQRRITSQESPLTVRARRMMAANTQTRRDGSFRFKGLLAGVTFNVMVHNGMYARSGEAGPPGWVAAAQSVRPQSGKATKIPDIVLTRGALIEGRIEDATTGEPLANMSVGCHGPHRPLSTGFITHAVSDSSGRFELRVPAGKNWVYWNGPVQNLRAEVHFGNSTPYEKNLEVVKSGDTVYGSSDFVEVQVDDGPPSYSRSGNGGLGEANEIEVKAGQSRRLTFRLTPLRIKQRPGQVPLVKLSDQPPVSGTKPIAWNPNAKLPARAAGIITGRVVFPVGSPQRALVLNVQIQDRAIVALPGAPSVYTEAFRKLPMAQQRMLKQKIVTSWDGSYRITGLLDAPYDISFEGVTDLSPVPAEWMAPPLAGIEPRQNLTVKAPDMKVQRGALIRGQVSDAQTKAGLPQVFLVVDDGRRPASTQVSQLFDAKKDGTFAFRVLPGTVRIQLNFIGVSINNAKDIRLGSHSYDLTRTAILLDGKSQKLGSSVPIEVSEGQTRTINFEMPRNS